MMQQLHQVLVRRRAGRLDDEDVARADVLLDLDVDLAVGEAADLGLAEARSPRCVAISCASAGFALPVNSTVLKSTIKAPLEAAGVHSGQEIWQGRKDSNPRMSESKSDALTSLATPYTGARLAPFTCELCAVRESSPPRELAQSASG